MRWIFALASVMASAALHVGLAAWVLPEQVTMKIAGGVQQPAVLIMGKDEFDAIAGGEPEIQELPASDLEEEVTKTLPQPEFEEELDVVEHAKPPADTAEATQAEEIVEPEFPIQSARPIEKVEKPIESPVVDPVQTETAQESTNIPVPLPRPNIPAKQAKKKTANPANKKPPSQSLAKKSKPKPAKNKVAETRNKKKKPQSPGAKSHSKTNAARGSAAAKPSKDKKQGNAKASKYPGKVYAKIARTKRKKAGGSGTARVRFVISANGRLSKISLAKSSKSKQVDQAALDHVKRAAPFPKPPAGAKRTFVIPVQFKN
ncbi:MAG: TonB family protein [Pseudomonadota bacterium]